MSPGTEHNSPSFGIDADGRKGSWRQGLEDKKRPLGGSGFGVQLLENRYIATRIAFRHEGGLWFHACGTGCAEEFHRGTETVFYSLFPPILMLHAPWAHGPAGPTQ
jgi:hypothetical protein